MNKLIKVRKLNSADLESLVVLYRQFWGENSDLDKMYSKFNDLANNPKYKLLCAEMDGMVVGSVMGIICEELYGSCKPFMLMENLIIDLNFRNKGIGRALLTELETLAKNNDCTQILFITEKERTDAVSFYKAMGYNAESHIGFKKSLI